MKRTMFALWTAVCLGLAISPSARAGTCPNLAIVVDRSGSMLLNTAGGTPMNEEPTRWQIAQRVLANLINRYDGQLPLGISYFPRATTTCGNGSFLIKPGYGNKQALLDSLYAPQHLPVPAAQTPTCGAIDAVAADPIMKDPSRKQYVLLLTDGAPRCVSGGTCMCEACNLGNLAPIGASESIRLALAQSPSVHTFVVGFSGSFMPTEEQNLNDMAREGGEINKDPAVDYYPADNEAALQAQLDGIIRTIVGGGDTSSVSICDDSCYSVGCPAGQICRNRTCQANPCATTSCGADQVCYFDGASARCVGLCSQSCPAGQRCIRGECQSDPCGQPCGASKRCNAQSGSCEDDPACRDTLCRPTQGCVGGVCVDDPCLSTTCPSGYVCIAHEGSCVASGDITTGISRGCQCELGQGSAPSGAVSTSLALLGFWLLRRRRLQKGPRPVI